MHLIPLYEKIVVTLPNKQEMTSQTGLTIVNDMSMKGNTTMVGEVVAVGHGRLLQDGTTIPLKVSVGDKVIFSKMSGENYVDETGEYQILSESNILSIIGGK